jgi:hypothetical protein
VGKRTFGFDDGIIGRGVEGNFIDVDNINIPYSEAQPTTTSIIIKLRTIQQNNAAIDAD